MTDSHYLNCGCCPNPIVRETRLKAYPGWVVREYKNGHFDGTNGHGLTGGTTSFVAAVAFVREMVLGR